MPESDGNRNVPCVIFFGHTEIITEKISQRLYQFSERLKKISYYVIIFVVDKIWEYKEDRAIS